MIELKRFITESMSVDESKDYNWDYCFFVEDLYGAQAVNAVINIKSSNEISKIFGNSQFKSDGDLEDPGWYSIAKSLKREYSPEYHFAVISFDTRGAAEVRMSNYDEVSEILSEGDNYKEYNDKFTMRAFGKYISDTLCTSSINGSYFKY